MQASLSKLEANPPTGENVTPEQQAAYENKVAQARSNVEEAKQDATKIPKAIIETTKDKFDKSGKPLDPIKTLEKNCLEIFKDRVGTILTIGLYVPVLALSNRIFPVVADWLVKDNDND